MTTALIGEILISQGSISAETLTEVLPKAREYGLRLGQALILEHCCTETEVANALAEKFGHLRIDLSGLQVDAGLLARVRAKTVERLRIIPVAVEEQGDRDVLVVATAHPENLLQIDELRIAVGLPVEIRVAIESQVSHVISEIFGRDCTQATTNMGLLDVVFTQFAHSADQRLHVEENQHPIAITGRDGDRGPQTPVPPEIMRALAPLGTPRLKVQFRPVEHEDLEEFVTTVLPGGPLEHCRRVGGITHIHRDPEYGRFKITVQNYRPLGAPPPSHRALVYSLHVERVGSARVPSLYH